MPTFSTFFSGFSRHDLLNGELVVAGLSNSAPVQGECGGRIYRPCRRQANLFHWWQVQGPAGFLNGILSGSLDIHINIDVVVIVFFIMPQYQEKLIRHCGILYCKIE